MGKGAFTFFIGGKRASRCENYYRWEMGMCWSLGLALLKQRPPLWSRGWQTLCDLYSDVWKWQPTPEFLPAESHGQRSLVCYSSWSHKESDTTEVTHEHVWGGTRPCRMLSSKQSDGRHASLSQWHLNFHLTWSQGSFVFFSLLLKENESEQDLGFEISQSWGWS